MRYQNPDYTSMIWIAHRVLIILSRWPLIKLRRVIPFVYIGLLIEIDLQLRSNMKV